MQPVTWCPTEYGCVFQEDQRGLCVSSRPSAMTSEEAFVYDVGSLESVLVKQDQIDTLDDFNSLL